MRIVVFSIIFLFITFIISISGQFYLNKNKMEKIQDKLMLFKSSITQDVTARRLLHNSDNVLSGDRRVSKKLSHLEPVNNGSHLALFHFNHHPIIDGIADLMLHWKWNNVIILVDSSLLGLDHWNLESYLLNKFVDNVTILDASLSAQFLEVLRWNTQIKRQIVVICSLDLSDSLIHMAKFQGLLGNHSQWIIAYDGVPSALKNFKILPTMQIITVHRNNGSQAVTQLSKDEVVFCDVFFSTHTERAVAVQFATWNIAKGLLFLEDFLNEVTSHKTLLGRYIRTTGISLRPFVRTSLHINGSVTFSGYTRDIFEIILFDFFKANELTVRQEDGVSGGLVNGTYNGIVGSLYRKEADLTPNTLGETHDRVDAVQFVAFVRLIALGLGYELPKAAIAADAYILPFSPITWLYIAAALAGILTCLVITEFSRTSEMMDDGGHSRSFRLLTGAFFEKVLQNPETPATKIIYTTLLLATLVLFTVYSSVLTSFLASQQMALPIREFEDLARRQDYKPLMIQASNWEDTFRNSQDDVIVSIWKRVERCGRDCFAASYEAAAQKVMDGKYVYIAEKTVVQNYLSDPCRCKVVPTTYARCYMFFPAKRDFPFARIMYKMVLRLHETGIVRRFGTKYKLDSYPDCQKEMTGESMDLHQVQGLFYILIAGILLSLIVLGMEIATYRGD